MLKVGIVGIGYWGPNILRAFMSFSDVHVKTVCDLDEKRLQKISAQYPSIETTTDYDSMLHDSDIDAVAVVVSSEKHFHLAKEALLSGKNVFVEKPLSLTSSDAQELVSLAEKEHKILMVGHLLEYHPAVNKMKDLINSGEVGDIYYIYSTRVNLGKIKSEENALWSLAPHDISVVLYLLDPMEPLEVQAIGGDYLKEGVEDVTIVNMRFEKKIIASVHVSWLDPHKIRKFTLVGNKKMLVFDDMETTEKIKVYDKGVDYNTDYSTYKEYCSLRFGDIVIPKVDIQEPLLIECRHFIDSIKTGKQPRTDGKDGLRVVKVLEAAQNSLDNNSTWIRVRK